MTIKVGQYKCLNPRCQRKYFTRSIREVQPHARHSREAKNKAKKLYRKGNASLLEVQAQMREDFHNSAGKSSVLRWHQRELESDYPQIAGLGFSHVLVVDELYSRTAGDKDFVLTCLDPVNHITLRLIIDKKLDADSLGEALQVVKSLGAEPTVIVSDSNHAERGNRKFRSIERQRYGWVTKGGKQAFLVVLQGFRARLCISGRRTVVRRALHAAAFGRSECAQPGIREPCGRKPGVDAPTPHPLGAGVRYWVRAWA
ncbi:MAG: hypothetical protein ACUVX1_16375 [Chloroflexota bacterium]